MRESPPSSDDHRVLTFAGAPPWVARDLAHPVWDRTFDRRAGLIQAESGQPGPTVAPPEGCSRQPSAGLPGSARATTQPPNPPPVIRAP